MIHHALVRLARAVVLVLVPSALAFAQRIDSLGADVRRYTRLTNERVVLTHVRVIDGTGAPALADRNVTIEGGRIVGIDPGTDVSPRAGTAVLDLRGFSVLPGIVGMHDHLFAMARPSFVDDNSPDGPSFFMEMPFSAPRLYLAKGVTTIRTTGSASPYVDLRLKQGIESGVLVGPHMDVTGPYLEVAPASSNPMLPRLVSAEDARQTVAFWAERGATSFKAYQDITRNQLRAAIEEAHKRGLKVTGHLCSVTYPEAIALGIDNLEHGFSANTEHDVNKLPDACPPSGGDYTLEHMTPESPDGLRLIAMLVAHHVAITSTLPLRAAGLPGLGNMPDGRALPPGLLDVMSQSLRDAFDRWSARPSPTRARTAVLLRNEMALERAFVAAGGLLLAGPDPVGLAGLVPGFADHRELELLVEAGFTPLEAIRIGTLNGAIYLARSDRIGSIAIGKNADLLVVRGDPATRIDDIENVEIVFKDGVGYDVQKLLASVKGRYGEY